MHPAAFLLGPLLAFDQPAFLDVRADADDVVIEEVTEHAEAVVQSGAAYGTVRAEAYRTICTAPCRVEIASGPHELRIRSGGSWATYHAMISPGDNGVMARAGNGWLVGTSTFLFVGGGLALAAGAGLTAAGYALDDHHQLRTPGIVTLAAGAGAMVLAIPIGRLGRAELGAAPAARSALPAVRFTGTF
jgi:hypothetical protein